MSKAIVPDAQPMAPSTAAPGGRPSDRAVGTRHVWMALIVGVAGLWLGAVTDGSSVDWTSRWLPVASMGLAAQVIWSVSRVTDHDGRRGWRWLAGAVLVAFGSRGANAVFGSGSRLGALLIMAFAAMTILGLLTLPRLRASRHQELRIWLEAAGASVAAAALAWETLLVHDAGESAGARLVGHLPALFEVVALGGLIVVLLRRHPFRHDTRLLALGLGVLLLVMADLFAPTSPTSGIPASLDLGASAALILVGFYGRQPLVKRQVAAAPTDWWKKLVPFGLMLSLFAVLFWRVTALDRLDVGVLPWAGLVVFLLMIVRQGAGMEENRELVEAERDQLIMAFSHELRVPLTAVAGFAEVLAGGWRYLSEAERTELLRIVRDHSAQLVDIVDDMALVVRDELADARLHQVRLDGKEVIAHAIRSVFDLNRGPVPVKAEVEPYLEFVADRRRLLEILVNLLKNAQRYGSGKILIVARRSAEGRVIEVHDDGEGLPPRYENLIWQRFERGAHRLNDDVPGSGLGLSIVRALAEAHGGSAGYRRSERLGGACFVVELPYDPDLDVARDAAAATA